MLRLELKDYATLWRVVGPKHIGHGIPGENPGTDRQTRVSTCKDDCSIKTMESNVYAAVVRWARYNTGKARLRLAQDVSIHVDSRTRVDSENFVIKHSELLGVELNRRTLKRTEEAACFPQRNTESVLRAVYTLPEYYSPTTPRTLESIRTKYFGLYDREYSFFIPDLLLDTISLHYIYSDAARMRKDFMEKYDNDFRLTDKDPASKKKEFCEIYTLYLDIRSTLDSVARYISECSLISVNSYNEHVVMPARLRDQNEPQNTSVPLSTDECTIQLNSLDNYNITNLDSTDELNKENTVIPSPLDKLEISPEFTSLSHIATAMQAALFSRGEPVTTDRAAITFISLIISAITSMATHTFSLKPQRDLDNCPAIRILNSIKSLRESNQSVYEDNNQSAYSLDHDTTVSFIKSLNREVDNLFHKLEIPGAYHLLLGPYELANYRQSRFQTIINNHLY